MSTEEDDEKIIKFTDFDADFQRKLVALQIRDHIFARRTEGLLKPDYFESRVDATLYNLASLYFNKYKRSPADKATFIRLFKGAIKQKRIRNELKDDCIDALKSLFNEDIGDRDFAIDQVGDFARHQAIQAAMLEAFDDLEKHDTDKAQEKLSKAFQVGPHADSEPYDYWQEIESRTDYRVDVKSGKIKPFGISTGIKKIDNLLFHKGWGIGELSVIMASAKKGKSFMIWFMAKLISEQGKNVLGVTLEMSKAVVSDRLDAATSENLIDELSSSILDTKDKVQQKSKHAGKFMLHEFPSGTFRPMDLDNLIETYKAKGIVFDAIVIDYLDIMAPNRWTQDPIENSRTVWIDSRAIAQRESLVFISATQTNREGHKSATAKAEHAAEDFNKIRTADLVISINATEEEMAAGEARLFFAASRNQKGEYAVRIKRDLSRGLALQDVIGYE